MCPKFKQFNQLIDFFNLRIFHITANVILVHTQIWSEAACLFTDREMNVYQPRSSNVLVKKMLPSIGTEREFSIFWGATLATYVIIVSKVLAVFGTFSVSIPANLYFCLWNLDKEIKSINGFYQPDNVFLR